MSHTTDWLQVTAVDTNGAGDTFATAYMLALMQGQPQPGRAANWAAAQAVSQPQARAACPSTQRACSARRHHGQPQRLQPQCMEWFSSTRCTRRASIGCGLQGCKPQCVETAIRAALRRGGSRTVSKWSSSFSELRANVPAVVDSCASFGRHILGRARQLWRGQQRTSDPLRQSTTALQPHVGDVQAA